MKTNAISMFLALGAACVGGSALNAQSTQNLFSAKVPFAFQVAGKAFEPGKYVLREQGYLGVPSIQNAKTGASVFIAGADHSLAPAGSPKLTFRCYAGHTCFLSAILPSNGPGSNVAMTRQEKEIANSDHLAEVATISVELRRGM
jgi:hypothetical protein